MKIQFDPQQDYQLEAVSAVVDIFDGQPLEKPDFSVIFQTMDTELFGGQTRSELGIGNNVVLSGANILSNVQKVQDRNEIDVTDKLESWQLDGASLAALRPCYHFSVEMETGTGKTYVYLRTIFELSRKYGFKKFIIVVPSVAIREGVLKNLEITGDHFRALYSNPEFEYFVYDAKKVNKLRQFAVSNTIQILVINIDAFRKNFMGTEAENKSNVIYRENDRLSGRQPIEFIKATHPIVIIDEPQSVDSTERAQEAIKSLNPLCTLRYSATHKNPYNLVYRLDPVEAYKRKLVKQIVVSTARAEGTANYGYVKLIKVDHRKGIKATLKIHVQGASGPKEASVTVKQDSDLFVLSKDRAIYKDGYIITEISAEPGNEFVQFNNGRRLLLGQEIGGVQEDVWKLQIRKTVERHLDREIQVREKGLKVLSLFFIDKVANYRSYDESGHPVKGKFALIFEEALEELLKQERYKGLLPFSIASLHNGYFAQDKKGVFKDTRGDSQADDEVYNLIMKEKEQLLSLDEPLRFIFSHSALREGWDNPNVFQICTLNETRSATKKRQEIGRGLRLPVNQKGERVFDDSINKLLVVANESYEDFAKALQTEYEEDCGVTFGKVPKRAFAKIAKIEEGKEVALGRESSEALWKELATQGFINDQGHIQPSFQPQKEGFSLALSDAFKSLQPAVIDILQSYQIERHILRDGNERKLELKKGVLLDENFKALWSKIKPKTTFSVEYSTEDLIRNTVKEIKKMEKIIPVRISYAEAALNVERKGVETTSLRESSVQVQFTGSVPDVIAYLQNETELSRSTLVRILMESGRLAEFLVNPQVFMDAVAAILKRELHHLMIDGIKYERLADEEWSMRLFEEEEIVSYLHNRLEVQKSVYDAIVYDSEIERSFAEALDKRDDIKLFVKLPSWFTIETPIGTYNPDWAIMKHDNTVLYLVRETKGTKDFEKLRNSEAEKIRCGRRHFETIGTDFDVVVNANEV